MLRLIGNQNSGQKLTLRFLSLIILQGIDYML